MSGIIEFLSPFFRLALGDVIVKVQLVLCFFFQKIRYFSYCKFCETYTTSRNANVKVLKYFPQQKRKFERDEIFSRKRTSRRKPYIYKRLSIAESSFFQGICLNKAFCLMSLNTN